MPNLRRYPFHPDLRNMLRNIDAAPLGVRVIQTVMSLFNVSPCEAEILIRLSSFKESISHAELMEGLTFYPSELVYDFLNRLVNDKGLVIKTELVQEEFTVLNIDTFYTTPHVDAMLATITLDSIQQITYKDYVQYPADTADVSCGIATSWYRKFIRVITGTKEENTDSDLRAALQFCFSLLAPGQNPQSLIDADPQYAKKMHRIIYHRLGGKQSYADMMNSIMTFPKNTVEKNIT